MAAQKLHPLKKPQKSLSNISKEYAINIRGELVRLHKGMTKNEVITILGEPLKLEDCSSKLNEKLVFKIDNGKATGVRYSVLFNSDQLVYVAKLN